MSSHSNKTWRWVLLSSTLTGLVFCCSAFVQVPVHAAAGINQQLNFQGRLLNSSGATVPDGVYNIEFKIYQDGDGQSVGDTTGTPAGSLKWTENHLVSGSTGVTVKNGYLSVQLGSVNPFGTSIDWNQDTLWLSVDIGSTSSCTISTNFDTDCGGDGEMVPMKRLSANPYALNAGQLGGLTSAQYVQLAQGLQTEAGNSTNSIYINKTGTGGNFIDLQAGGTDAFVLDNSGNIGFGNNANHTISVTTAAAGAAGKSLTISAGAGGTGGTTLAGGNLTLQGGAGGGTNGNGGNITIDAGAPNGAGTGGTVNIGTANATAINIGTNNAAHTIAIGAGGAVQTITLGSANTTSSLLLQAGTGNLSIQTQGGTLGIGTNAVAQTITIGNTTGATSVTLQSGTGGISLSSTTTVAANFMVTNAGNVAFQKGSDYTTTGTSNDVNFGGGTLIRLTGASAQTITGIAGGANGRILTIVNAASQVATISNLNAGSTAANQISTGTGSDLSLAAGASIYLAYDSGSNLWRVVGSSSSATGFIQLQGSTPGTQQTGNFNISGTGIAGSFDSTASGTLSLGTNNASIVNIATNASAHTVSIANGGAVQAITIGSTTSTSSLLLQAGTGNLAVQTQGGTLGIGNNSVQQALIIGNATGSSSATVFCGTGSCTFGAGAAAHTTTIGTTNTTATTTIQGGTGGINIGTGGIANTIQIGTITGGVLQGINIGTNATASSTNNITIGSTVAGTVTLQGSGITTSVTGNSVTINTSSNSSSALQVQNSLSYRVFGVDTTSNQVLLGQSSHLNGTLIFKNSTNTNSVTIASGATNSAYTLTLPTAAPSTGLCLETSSGSASQLVFASCSNNNTSISEVQEWDANNTNSVTVSPFAVGDVIVLTTQIPTASVTVSSISGGGVTTWTKAIANNGNGTVNRVEMWIGTVVSTGSSNITVTYSSSPGAVEIAATEFTAAGVNASTSWGIESTASQLNSTASATVTFPNMIPINGAELYVGYGQVQNPPSTSGSTPGFSYIVTSTQHNIITYNPSTAANTAYQPTANQNSAGQSNTLAAILTAFVTSTAINNATSLQKANFYVQSATSGSIAGVLQAASSGSADILNLRNSSAVNVMSVGNTGATIFENSTNSSAAFQVQNSSGNSILSVNTSNNSVVLGKANTLAGALAFSDVSDSNTITLAAPTSVATSYTLTLPSNTPTAGLCLGTSPSNATQLIFASCATQVSAASISYVNKWDNHGTGVTTISDSPANIGNLLVFYSHTANAVAVNSISGGGVTSWTKVTAYSGGGTPGNIEMWRGVVTSAGAGTITVTYSGAAGTNEIVAQEYSMGSANGTWAIDTSGTATTTSSVTTVNYPSLTPLNSSELYTGYAYGGGTMSAGSTTGFTYLATGGSKYVAYNTNVTGGTAYAPTATQTSGVYASVAAVIAAYSGTSVIVDSTATQLANFNVQAATGSTVAGVLQAATSGTADIFQAKDSSGNNIVAVNSTNGLTLGTSNATAGQINFAASGNSNIISLTAPSTPGSSYSLTLPTTTPAAGQCLATSPNNANQLVFSSCANQVTSVAISYVNSWKGTSTASPATLSTSPTNVGDLMVLFVSFQKADSVNSGGVSGGGCGTSWSKVAATSSGSGTDTTSIEMWRCQITSTGSSPISVTWSGPAGTHELAAMEFTTGNTSGSWVVDASNAQYNSTSSTTVSYPNITPQSTKDLYVGYGAAPNTMSAGSTSGFTYLAGSLTNRYGLYNTSVSAAVAPTANQSSAGVSITAGALIAAYSSSSVISNSTVTQEANFNIQAATTGTVAGVLQAAASGSADVMQIMNASGTVVDSFGSTGNLLVQPSTASANAFRVQTTGGANVLSVDTSGLQVVVGAGSTGETTPTLLVVDSQTGSSADPTGVNGAMYYNATTHSFRCNVDGAWQTCSGLIYSNTSNSTAVNNCTNNCSAFSTFASVPANYCQTGRVFTINATGYFSSVATPSNLQFGIYYGTSSTSAASDTLIGTLTPAVSVTSASNNYFQINDTIICFSTSSMQSGGTVNIQTGSGGMTAVPIASTSGTTVSSSSAKNFYVFPIWDNASTSNTAVMTQMAVNAY